MAQSPMMAVPLKATNEIDWVAPLKTYIRDTYGDDPERYAEECATLNRLRQDMRGAGKESTSGRDMLYRYYGQLELLDLRFPVDEQHIKISFTWFDAFTHKATSQYSLAFEKASIIFNIAAVLSCYAARQNRAEESAIKVAYHSLQASAGMFTYINENFLHAPSSDLSRETVQCLINLMLAQAQEVFLEKQVADQKKVGLLAKLAAQAGYLYKETLDGIQENVNKAIFDKGWLMLAQVKSNLLNSYAQYYQALADDDSNQHGIAAARLQSAQTLAKEAERQAKSFPANPAPSTLLSSESGPTLQELTKRHHSAVQEKLKGALKDNDFIYHQTVPAEAGLPAIAKLPAAKPIPVSELYAGQDIGRITGPDLFAKIVPLAVTESASLYDEEKAKLVRAETEKVDTANGEMAASLDYLRLPGALQVLKGGFDQDILPDEDFRQWCEDVANHENPGAVLESLRAEKENIMSVLDKSSKQLDMEESVCEKMRSKYETEWAQQPSSRLTSTLRSDIRSYREALGEAMRSDNQLAAKLRQNQAEFDEMRRAVQDGRVDELFQRAVAQVRARSSDTVSPSGAEPNLLDADFDESGPGVVDQIAKVEDILKKLNLIKRERNQVLKDLKEKVHNDDISQILILNKKSIANYETQLFEQELEKFQPHQTRLLQANHKQSALMKDLTKTFNALLQDKRVRSEQSKYEAIQRQRSSVINRYKRAYQDFLDLQAGVGSAKNWYVDMKETVGSLEKNVETFVNNRRSEGAQLLDQIERERNSSKSAHAQLEQERLRGLMDRMSMEPVASPPQPSPSAGTTPSPFFQQSQAPRHHQTSFQGQSPAPTSPPPPQAHLLQRQQHLPQQYPQQQQQQPSYGGYANNPTAQPHGSSPVHTYAQQQPYNPSQFGTRTVPTSPSANASTYGVGGLRGPGSPSSTQTSLGQAYSTYGNTQSLQLQQPSYVPPGFVPPPPPPGPPPLGPQQTIHYGAQHQEHGPSTGHPSSGQRQPQQQQQQAHDPWSGLNAWR